MRYLDTGSNDPDHTLGRWLDTHCSEDISSFKAQFGYFSYAAVESFVNVFRSLSKRDGTVDFVLGSNNASLRRTDLESLVEAVGGLSSTITVVAFRNAEFHPKTVHISSKNGTQNAIVTSANLTFRGAGTNIEAGVSLSTQDGDDPKILGEIESSIDRWKTTSQTGVFHVQSIADVRSLKLDKIIGEREVDPFNDNSGNSLVAKVGLGVRSRLWYPSKSRLRASKSEVKSETGIIEVPVLIRAIAPLMWYKKMPLSDAQWPAQGNPTGKLRLTKGEFPINQQTYFVGEFFSNVLWESEVRKGKIYMVADVDFDVEIDGMQLGFRTLKVDFAEHRAADQDNHTTVIAWGRELGQILRSKNHSNWWVVLQRASSGNFSLKVQISKPN